MDGGAFFGGGAGGVRGNSFAGTGGEYDASRAPQELDSMGSSNGFSSKGLLASFGARFFCSLFKRCDGTLDWDSKLAT